MSRPQTIRASLLVVAFAWSTTVHAQVTTTAPTPKPADVQPTPPQASPPAPVQPSIDPVVITATPQPATATQATPAPPAAALPPTATPTPARQPARMSVSHRPTETTDAAAVGDVSSPFSLMGVIDHRWNTSASFDLFSDNDVTTHFGLALAYDALSLTDDLELAVELGWNTGDSHRTGLLGGAITRTELLTHNVQAALTARWDLLPWLAPHARLSAGLSVIDMSLQSQIDDVTFTDHVVAPFMGLGVGTSVQTTPRALVTRNGYLSSLRLGARVEVGYTLAGTAGFALHAKDDLRVPVTEASTGGLSRSGPYIHTAGFVRF